jgi:hypothetical protein
LRYFAGEAAAAGDVAATGELMLVPATFLESLAEAAAAFFLHL